MAASEPEVGVQMRDSLSIRARVQFRESHSGPPKMEGYLRKRTAKLNLKWFWRKYWFVLDGRSLLFFKSQSDYNSLGTCKGLVDFGLVQAVRPSHGSKNTYAMEVITRSDVIHLAADDWETRQVWVAALQAAIQISEVSWPFEVQLDNAPTLVRMQRAEICNSKSPADSERRRSRRAERSQRTSSLIIYENVSLENVAPTAESSDRRPSSEGAIYQQISEAKLTAHDSEAAPTDESNVFGKGHPCSHKKKDKSCGMLRRARSFSFMAHKRGLPGFHWNRDKSSKSCSKGALNLKHNSASSPAQTPDSKRASQETKSASHQKQDSIGSVRAMELPPRQSGPKSPSHQKQGSTGSAKLRVDAMPKVQSRLDSSSSKRVAEHRITAILDVNPTYQTAGGSRTDRPGEPAQKRHDSDSQDNLAPDFPSRPHPSPMPRSNIAMMFNREYAGVYEDHMPPSPAPKTGDEYRTDNHSTSLRTDQIDAMIPNREYAEVNNVQQSSLKRPMAHAGRNGSNSPGQMQAPSSEYAEIIEGDNTPSLHRTFSNPPGCDGSNPPERRPSNPESSYPRKISKDSVDDSSLHIYHEVRGSSRSPSPQPSPRTVFIRSLASSTRPADMDDEDESYYSSISEEDLRRYQWSSDLARVGETSETGTESSTTYNTADASGSSEALAETGYMEDNPHIAFTATDSGGSASSSGRQGATPSSEVMHELRELLECLGTGDGSNMLTGQRSIARARQLLVREMAGNEA